MRHNLLKSLLLAAVMASGCATAPKPRPASPEATAARVRDTAEERVTAQRASDPKVDREAEERRWNMEQAQALRRDEEAKRRAAQEAGGPGVDVKKAKK